MITHLKQLAASATVTLLLCSPAAAQHLWWDLEGQKDATCLYGEITVLATAPHIYYCGANWHPGEPAGGYCGIQHNSDQERRTIFSIWDTSPKLHPTVTAADPKTITNRFGGEGEGGHTHMVWPWKVGETFQFLVEKRPGKAADATDTRYFIFDPAEKHWRAVATISSSNGGHQDVATIGGGLNSFLENFAGRDRELPKLALYRLWLGKSVDRLHCLTRAGGDGKWGTLHDCYFLAEGDKEQLDKVFAGLEAKYGRPESGSKGAKLAPIADQALSADLVRALGEALAGH